MSKFNIVRSDSKMQIVEGDLIEINGEKCFIHEDLWGFNVSHFFTGMHMAINLLDKQTAIDQAKRNMLKYPDALEKGKETLKKYGFEYPINS